jgi:hypothetical protein
MAADAILDLMKRHNIPLTRENYLDIAYFGNPPEELDAEAEAELPLEFRKKNHPNDWEEFE